MIVKIKKAKKYSIEVSARQNSNKNLRFALNYILINLLPNMLNLHQNVYNQILKNYVYQNIILGSINKNLPQKN